jgi:hypothetical protein
MENAKLIRKIQKLDDVLFDTLGGGRDIHHEPGWTTAEAILLSNVVGGLLLSLGSSTREAFELARKAGK